MDYYEEACSLSTSDAEPDSDFEDVAVAEAPTPTTSTTIKSPSALDWDDPQELLNTWLGQLDSIHKGLDIGGSRPAPAGDADKLQLQEPPMDSYRFSRANLEDSQDGELDAILKELCVLGSQFEEELKEDKPSTTQEVQTNTFSRKTDSRTNSVANKIKLDIGPLTPVADVMDNIHRTDSGLRTESPDNDSAFSDCISMLSSESSASSGASAARTDASKGSATSGASSASTASSSSAAPDSAAQLKAEKIRLALQKMREANVKKLYIKAFSADGSAKSLLVDEKMTVGHVIRLLADKNHVRMEPKWSLVEHCTDLLVERVYEDHELLVDQLLLWTCDSRNRLLFVERSDKYALISRPEDFLLTGREKLDDDSRTNLLEEFFSGTAVGVPDIEGPLWLKSEGKKAWKKYYFVLRASGLYYSSKGRSKNLKDLVCLATFDGNQVYSGINWRKKYKAPSDFGFALKHPKLQAKSAKFIKYLCADDQQTWARWIMAIRIAKNGKKILENYRSLLEDLAQEDLDQLANARSFSLVSMATGTPVDEVANSVDSVDGSSSDTPVNTLEKIPKSDGRFELDGSLNGSLNGSDQASNGTCTPTLEHGFDCDFPTGTIKRKPSRASMTPKIPLTSTTRLLVREVDSDVTDSGNALRSGSRHSFRKSLTEEVNTVRRKNSMSPSDTASFPEDIDALPLPPPPEPEAEELTSGPESLPPPPPEAFDEELPLPPPENLIPLLKFPAASTPSTLPARKLPSPTQQTTLKPCLKPSSSLTGPKVPPKPPIGRLPRQELLQPIPHPAGSSSDQSAQSSITLTTKKNRRITFDDNVTDGPLPPQRENIPFPQKLNSPGCAVTPPRDFLKDLQRVMQKKWQVAQKCKADVEITPHEVLGFRDVPSNVVPTAYKENNVRAWVVEHYGSSAADEEEKIPENISTGIGYFSNVFVPSANRVATSDIYQNSVELRRDFPHPYLPQQQQQLNVSSAASSSSRLSTASSGSSKRLPPPPPKRSDTTHLSTRIH